MRPAAGPKTPRRDLGQAASRTGLGGGKHSAKGKVLERALVWWQRRQRPAFKGTAPGWSEVPEALDGIGWRSPAPPSPGAFSRPGPAGSRYTRFWAVCLQQDAEGSSSKVSEAVKLDLFPPSARNAGARVRGLVSLGARAVGRDVGRTATWAGMWGAPLLCAEFVVTKEAPRMLPRDSYGESGYCLDEEKKSKCH